ncbi:MAG: hypothetical protein Q9160_004434 [Pyrenula sp. 1 TL-2023]
MSRIFKPRGSILNPRTITAPIGAFCMAMILYVYSVKSIRAAKRNAQLHREADGGQLDMRKESLRRHGMRDQVEGTKDMQLLSKAGWKDKTESQNMGGNKAKALGEATQREGGGRTDVEEELHGLKGRAKSQEITLKALAAQKQEAEREARGR